EGAGNVKQGLEIIAVANSRNSLLNSQLSRQPFGIRFSLAGLRLAGSCRTGNRPRSGKPPSINSYSPLALLLGGATAKPPPSTSTGSPSIGLICLPSPLWRKGIAKLPLPVRHKTGERPKMLAASSTWRGFLLSISRTVISLLGPYGNPNASAVGNLLA